MKRPCPTCGASMSPLTRFCAACGTANPARTTVLAMAAAIAVLVPAIAVAIYAATRWERPLIEGGTLADQTATPEPTASSPTGPGPMTPAPAPAGQADDFAWLSTAMKECDAKAAQEPDVLHFLIVPLASDSKFAEDWRTVSLNTIGNAVVLPGTDTLNGLQRRTLTIAPGEYAFSIRIENTQAVRRWDASTGVKWISTPGAGAIALFRIQFKPRDKGRDDAWGNAIAHQRGNCYWINALTID